MMRFVTRAEGRVVEYTVGIGGGPVYSKPVTEDEERMLLRAIDYGKKLRSAELRKLLED